MGNFAPQKPSAAASSKPAVHRHVLLTGTSVVVHGLEHRLEHNGKSGRVLEWNTTKSRYEVALNCGGVLSVRPQNLTQLCDIILNRSNSCSHVQDMSAEVVDFNDEKGQYVLLVNEPPSVVSVSPKHCIFPVGTAGVLQGLSNPELNGQMCCIIDIDRSAARYTVASSTGKQLKLRFEKILC